MPPTHMTTYQNAHTLAPVPMPLQTPARPSTGLARADVHVHAQVPPLNVPTTVNTFSLRRQQYRLIVDAYAVPAQGKRLKIDGLYAVDVRR